MFLLLPLPPKHHFPASTSSVNLFHSGVGATRETRFVAISIYRDGLSHVPNISKYIPTLPFLNYKPWALRKVINRMEIKQTTGSSSMSKEEQNSSPTLSDAANEMTTITTTVTTTPQAVTKRAKEEIYQFIDQPGDSLRDDIDELDFARLENDDLSTIQPPEFNEKDWLLVDTAEKMKQCVREIQVTLLFLFCLRFCLVSNFTKLKQWNPQNP